jgi:hypothetical protein
LAGHRKLDVSELVSSFDKEDENENEIIEMISEELGRILVDCDWFSSDSFISFFVELLFLFTNRTHWTVSMIYGLSKFR